MPTVWMRSFNDAVPEEEDYWTRSAWQPYRTAILGLRSRPISVASYDRMRRAQTFGSSSSSPKRSTSLRKPAVGRDTEAGPLELGDRLVVLAAADLVLAPPTLREECPTQPHEDSARYLMGALQHCSGRLYG
jgi:hypothetical protein